MSYTTIHIDTAAPKNVPNASLLIIYTGGTFGMVYDENHTLIPFDFSQILEKVPALKSFNVKITVVSFDELIDSSNISSSHWIQIGEIISKNYSYYDGFVVLHGTDTMAYSASALSYMLEGLNKPVIFTGAQLPIGARRSDAANNLITALEIASNKTNNIPTISEVCIYFDNLLLRGNRSKKVESTYFDAFESENYPILAEAGVNIIYNYGAIQPYNDHSSFTLHKSFCHNVAILKLFPNISSAMVEHILALDTLEGIILETYGSGNAPTVTWFIKALEKAVQRGVIIFNVSQCNGGNVVQGKYATSRLLKQIGVVGGDDITIEAAITKMMFLLGNEKNKDAVKRKLSLPLCGEMGGINPL